MRVFDAAVAKVYGGKRKIHWMEVYAGEKSNNQFGTWLPEATVQACRDYLVGIKGPLTTPDRRRHPLAQRGAAPDARPLRLPAPGALVQGRAQPGEASRQGRHGDLPREHAKTSTPASSSRPAARPTSKILEFLKDNFPKEYGKIRFPETSGIGIKPVSKDGTERLVRAAIDYAIRNKRKSVTIVHKGNIMKFTEGAFRNWGYALAEREFGDQVYTWDQWERTKAAKGEAEANAEQKAALAAGKVLIKDAIADITLQQVLTRPEEFDVIATLNLNGDYLSDALAAQVGGIGIAPGGNINYVTGHAVFEATHGTAPKYANLDKVNPGSVILSGEMMLRYMGWTEAADALIRAMDVAIAQQDGHLRLRAPDGRRDRDQVLGVRRRADQGALSRAGGARAAPACLAPRCPSGFAATGSAAADAAPAFAAGHADPASTATHRRALCRRRLVPADLAHVEFPRFRELLREGLRIAVGLAVVVLGLARIVEVALQEQQTLEDVHDALRLPVRARGGLAAIALSLSDVQDRRKIGRRKSETSASLT